MNDPSTLGRSKRRGGILALVIAGVAVTGVSFGAYFAFAGGGDGATKPAATADRAVAKKMSFDVTTTANGELEARDKIEIRNPLDQQSTIVSIVDEGTWAKKGDLLIQLNADEIQQKIDEEDLRVRTATADLVAAEKGYEIQVNENESKLRQAELKVTLADLALEQWRDGDVRKKRQELDLAMDKATLELERLAEKFVRSQQLRDEGFLSKDECDRDEVSYIEAISAYTTSRMASDVYENYEFKKDEKSKISDLDEARSELVRVRLNNESELKKQESRRDNERSSLAIMQTRLDKQRKDKDSTSIKAPADGLVVYASSMERFMWGGSNGPLQIGQQVYPNQLLMILPDTHEMVAAVKVNESLAGRVKPGQPVSVKIDAMGGKVYEGKVDSIGVMAESGGWRDPNLREYTVRVSLKGDTTGLKPAMRCEGRLILDSVDDAVGVPVQAVFSEGAVQYVYEPRGSRFAKVPLRVGRRSETFAEISKGLDEGQMVLVREPTSVEILAEAWDTDVLKKLGYTIGENGIPMLESKPVVGAPGMKPQRHADAKMTEKAGEKKAVDKTSDKTGDKPVEKTAETEKSTDKPAEKEAEAPAQPKAATPAAPATVTPTVTSGAPK